MVISAAVMEIQAKKVGDLLPLFMYSLYLPRYALPMDNSIVRKKVIIDTDPGIDDAMAIFYALSSPEIGVVGLTSVFGNAHTEITTLNALHLLQIADRDDIPVAAGTDRPLVSDYRGPADFVHGSDGQGNVFTVESRPEHSTKPIEKRAPEFIIDMVRRHPGEITLVPLGPLTNVAMAMLLEPGFEKNLAEIVLMGGNAFVPGNATPTAEANIVNDPEAADIVFGAACPITMCGLDVTERILMTGEDLDRIAHPNTPRARYLASIVPFYRDFYRKWLKVDGIYVHDSTTISWLLHPEIFETVRYPIRVDTSNGLSRGKTWPSRGTSAGEEPWQDRPAVTICTGADSRKAVTYELERLGS